MGYIVDCLLNYNFVKLFTIEMQKNTTRHQKKQMANRNFHTDFKKLQDLKHWQKRWREKGESILRKVNLKTLISLVWKIIRYFKFCTKPVELHLEFERICKYGYWFYVTSADNLHIRFPWFGVHIDFFCLADCWCLVML